MAKTNGKGKLDEKKAEALLKQVCTCEPLMDAALVEKVDRMFQQENFGISRRCALSVATKDGAFFKSLKTDREAAVLMAQIFHTTGDQLRILKQTVQVFESVRARLMVALAARKDMDKVLAEGEAELGDIVEG